MYLIEQAEVPVSALPVPEFRAHLRLGSGFADDAVQNDVLEQALRGAIAQVETHCGKALLIRPFICTLFAWRNLGRQVLPKAPLVSLDTLTLVDYEGQSEVVSPDRYQVEFDTHSPSIVARGFVLPQIAVGGQAKIAFTAGFAPEWAGIPADLRQAVLALATRHYEHRDGSKAMPTSVEATLAAHRPMRLFGGLWR